MSFGTYNLLDNGRWGSKVDNSLVNAHLKAVPCVCSWIQSEDKTKKIQTLHTLPTRGFANGELEGFGRHSNWPFDLQIFFLRIAHQFSANCKVLIWNLLIWAVCLSRDSWRFWRWAWCESVERFPPRHQLRAPFLYWPMPYWCLLKQKTNSAKKQSQKLQPNLTTNGEVSGTIVQLPTSFCTELALQITRSCMESNTHWNPKNLS